MAIFITHKHCNDGYMAAVQVMKAWPDVTPSHFIELGHAPVDILKNTLEKEGFYARLLQLMNGHRQTDRYDVYVLDYSLPLEILQDIYLAFPNVRILTLDHHQTAINDHREKVMPWLRENNVKMTYHAIYRNDLSGAALAHMYFCQELTQREILNEPEGHYKNKVILDVNFPDEVKYVMDRDIWTWFYREESEPFTMELMARADRLESFWELFCLRDASSVVEELIDAGRSRQRFLQELMEMHVPLAEDISVKVDGEVFKGKMVNAPRPITSHLGNYLSEQEGYHFCVLYYHDGKGWKVGLRSRKSFDCSRIATYFGGGGHAQASGIPFKDDFNFTTFRKQMQNGTVELSTDA